MLTNSDVFLCSEFLKTHRISPCSPLINTNSIPRNLERISPTAFRYCEVDETGHKTRIMERQVNGEARCIEELEGAYTNWDFCNDYTLMLNREGDFMLYNALNKNIYQAEKQHPGQFADAQIMHTCEHFITCGGCVKNQISNSPQRIIKVWGVDNADCLMQKSRIDTGHKKPIQYSFLINKSHVVTLSSDKSVRFINILTEELTSLIQAKTDFLSGCQLDHNSVILGGIGKNLAIYDMRLSRPIGMRVTIPSPIIQIVNMTRFTDNHVLVANINEIMCLDLRKWILEPVGEYEGERISSILTLNNHEFVVGNREKTVQIWTTS